MNLSPKVSLLSATKSDTAIRLGIDNTPDVVQLDNMKRVAEKVIEPILSRFPTAYISSFFRSEKLNKRIGGARKSQHMTGEAVDLDSPNNYVNLDIFNFCKEYLTFDQLLLEKPDINGIPSWVHISLKDKDNRNQILVVLKDKTIPFGIYTVGMV